MTLIELAERCEAAMGSDRDLDADIARATGWQDVRSEGYGSIRGLRPTGKREHVMRFTASLDAAMTLVPEGWCFEVTNYDTFARVRAAVLGSTSYSADADTPALALCAAALRARAAMEPGK